MCLTVTIVAPGAGAKPSTRELRREVGGGFGVLSSSVRTVMNTSTVLFSFWLAGTVSPQNSIDSVPFLR